ncbi:MAG: hypothetical protein KC561_07255, partial [Myxococcales bacterium]|nr:hypothetical protein [Myxococcales bacterium]
MNAKPRIRNGLFRKALILEAPDPSLDGLLAQMGIEVNRYDRALSEEELVETIAEGGHDLIFKRSRTPITRAVVEAGSSLAAIMLCCIGDDSVDKQATADHGVLVVNDPVSNGRSVVEMVLGEAVCCARRLIPAHLETSNHYFSKSNADRYELMGRVMGVFGLGNIGKQVAQTAQAFGMEVVFYDTREVAVEVGLAMGWRAVNSLQDLFAASNVVTVHISAEDHEGQSNENIISFDDFVAFKAASKDGPRIFINAGRGFVHSSEDLLRAVNEGYVQSAFVDVFPEEPKSKSDVWQNPYAGCENIFTTPHIGAATQEAQPRIARQIAKTTQLLNYRGTLRDCVYRPGRALSIDPTPGDPILAVVHSTARGTKKAVDDAVFHAGASNVQSTHRDFNRYGIAYDLVLLDAPLSEEQVHQLIDRAVELTGDPC